jgi:hypothetical protein
MRNPSNIQPGRQRLALHLEDIREVRIHLQRELELDRALRESLEVQVIVQRAVNTSSEPEQQCPIWYTHNRISQQTILKLPLGSTVSVLRAPK